MGQSSPANASADSPAWMQHVTSVIYDIVTGVPRSSEAVASDPARRAREIVRTSAIKGAMISGSLALPPGPLGLLTILPDLVAIWRMQAQMVSDIAAAHGRAAVLTREAMIYCLFRHAAVQGLRDLVVRAGERYLVKSATTRALQRITEAAGIRITERAAGRAASRFVPLIGAVGVGAYAYYDTHQVGKTAIELFAHPQLEAEQPDEDEDVPSPS